MKEGSVKSLFLVIACLPQFFTFTAIAAELRLSSPNGQIRVVVDLPRPGSLQNPRWSAVFREKGILTNCVLSLRTPESGDLMATFGIANGNTRSVADQIPVFFGKSRSARDHFNESRFIVSDSRNRRTEVIFRCYDDAIAFRYEPWAEQTPSSITISDETTSFRLAGEPQAFVQYLENYKTSHEHQIIPTPYREIRVNALLDLPLTFSYPDGTYVAITEAALRNYAGMALMREMQDDALVCKLTPRADGTKVVRAFPMRTPWRVLLISDRPGALLESETISCLNEPNAIGDVSWIKPGKLTFHWWNGDVYDGKPGPPILSFEMATKYIDFCAANGIEFHGMSSTEGTTTPWYHQSKSGVEPGPDTDVTRPRPGFELERIKQYADSKGVRLWTWVHQGALRGRVEEAFAAFEKMGWSGMMVDFFDHDDQDHVEFTEEILKAAARHHILIHFHGIWKPTGLERTYPNLMNHEAALNLEYLKWSDLCTPEHTLKLAFTRLIAGPMDYHLGGFRALGREQFKPQHVAPNVLGTRCHMLAMYVCFDNPAPMVADFPTAYANQPGFDFLKTVPTYWDETKVLIGEIGEVLVTARRKGNAWYLGGLSAKKARDLSVPLSFLPARQYNASIWHDALGNDPNALELLTQKLSSRDALNIRVARDGGFVARLSADAR
jgi:alpha-glucosidase